MNVEPISIEFKQQVAMYILVIHIHIRHEVGDVRSLSIEGISSLNSIPWKLPIGNSTGYFTHYIEIVREICNSMARVK